MPPRPALPWVLLGTALSHVAGEAACGCSWRRDGCGVSGEQLVASVEALPYAVPGCADGLGLQTEECQLRRTLAMEAAALGECSALDFVSCKAAENCTWGAQQVGKCGFSQEVWLKWLNDSEAFVRYLDRHFACSVHGADTCIRAGCRWSVNRSHPECDAEATPGADFDPVRWWRVYAEGACRARHEARRGHGFGRSCSRPCAMRAGVCRFDHAGSGVDWAQTVKNRYCSLRWAETRRDRRHALESWGVAGSNVSVREALQRLRWNDERPVMASTYDWCPKKWCALSDGGCRGAAGPQSHDVDEARTRRLALLWSATALYERRCRAPELSLRAACEASAPLCAGGALASTRLARAPAAPLGFGTLMAIAGASACAGAVAASALGLPRFLARWTAAREAPFPGATRSPPLMAGAGGLAGLREAEMRRLAGEAAVPWAT